MGTNNKLLKNNQQDQTFEVSSEINEIKCFEQFTSQKQREFAESQFNCDLCATGLEFEYYQELDSECIMEKASCPQCRWENKPKEHSLQ